MIAGSIRLLVIFVVTLLASHAIAAEPSIQFDIPAQPLDQALIEFSRQSGLAVMLSPTIESRQKNVSLQGKYPTYEALRHLLSGTDLLFRQVGAQGIVIEAKQTATPQKAKPPAAIASRDRPILEEIIVTASKRPSRLQDTAMTISAFDANALYNQTVNSVFTLQAHVPSLRTVRNGDHSASMLYIRGIGSDNYTEAGDAGIATHIDGIYTSRSQGAAVLLYDLERIEVLRGPQGTLFGRNSTGGVINYHTAKPEAQFDSRVSVQLGNNSSRNIQLMLNTPLRQDWSLRLAAAKENRDSPLRYSSDSTQSKRSRQYNNSDLLSYRISSLYQPTPELNWLISYERLEDHGSGYIPLTDYKTPVLIDTPGRVELNLNSYRSRVDWQLWPDLNISYISGYSNMNRQQLWDGDRNSAVGSETDPLQYHQSNHTAWSKHSSQQHELQFKSADDARLRWLLAYFYFKEDSAIRFDIEHQTADGSGWGGAPAHSFIQPSRGSQFNAAYTQIGFNLSPQWSLSAGARSGQDKRFDRGGRNIACPNLIHSQRQGELGEIAVNRESAAAGQCYVSNYNDVAQSWNSTTYMGRLEFRPSDNKLFYLMFAQGFKPGVVQDGNSVSGAYSGSNDPEFQAALSDTIALNNSVADNSAYVDPEHSRNLELGFKLSLNQDTIAINGALFYTHYSDLQVSNIIVDEDGVESVRNVNAAVAAIKGFELEWDALLGNWGQISGQLSILDARYNQFLSVDDTFPEFGQTWNPGSNNGASSNQIDLSGNRLKQAPKLSLSINYQTEISLSDHYNLRPSISAYYSSKIYFDETNREQRSGTLYDHELGQWVSDANGSADDIDVQKAYWRWDASISINPIDSSWQLQFFVNNISNAVIKLDSASPDAENPEFYLAPPRTIGLKWEVGF